ncbi:shikimate dehydrogenase [Halobacillus halophilus]|uniref:shikimate dehydrogenase n=1 Tax=Halobacillus halophilus TaxID=1570 RepID=UPI001CD7D698|nr:shikimate dehydrogenase [Halobacillus halophilus]MCA1009751.1 shikimate dehydrogenase [Halobacillus halophilus]
MLRLGLIGHPVGHSLSPWIHERLMEHEGLEGTYELFDIEPDTFDQQIHELKNRGLDGFNITVPYKEKIIPYLDEVDSSARELGAVNTVKNTARGWVGYNTDGIGFAVSVRNRYPELFFNEQRVLIIGSGGASRGIYHALLEAGLSRIDIANRTIEKAEEVIKSASSNNESKALSLDKASEQLNDYGLIVQTTVVGMSPSEHTTIIPLHNLQEGTVVSDIVYRPLETRFLQEARTRGAKLHFGHEMLLQQAVYAFHIWTDTNPDASLLLEGFEKKLKGV